MFAPAKVIKYNGRISAASHTPFFRQASRNNTQLTSAIYIRRKCAGCDKEQARRKEAAVGDTAGKSAPTLVSTVLSSGGGQPMDAGARQFMESRFGQDFGQVRTCWREVFDHLIKRDVLARVCDLKHCVFKSLTFKQINN